MATKRGKMRQPTAVLLGRWNQLLRPWDFQTGLLQFLHLVPATSQHDVPCLEELPPVSELILPVVTHASVPKQTPESRVTGKLFR